MKNRIREYRKELLMSQEELARRSGVTRRTIISLENNENYVTTTKTLEAIAKVLNRKVSDLVDEDGEVT